MEVMFFGKAYAPIATMLAEDLIVVVRAGCSAATTARSPSTPRN